jgi:two-component system cell cycle sensor histidine kinase/response regulator CckA
MNEAVKRAIPASLEGTGVVSPIISLNDAVSNMERILRLVIGENIDLVMDLDPALGAVKADTIQIYQVLLNLAVLARNTLAAKLLIETRNLELLEPQDCCLDKAPPGSYVVLSVSNDCISTPLEILAHIFEPISTTKAMGHGSGLGLSTVYWIVRQSGGYLQVLSHFGEGTSFKIYLPQLQEAVGSRRAEIVANDTVSNRYDNL